MPLSCLVTSTPSFRNTIIHCSRSGPIPWLDHMFGRALTQTDIPNVCLSSCPCAIDMASISHLHGLPSRLSTLGQEWLGAMTFALQLIMCSALGISTYIVGAQCQKCDFFRSAVVSGGITGLFGFISHTPQQLYVLPQAGPRCHFVAGMWIVLFRSTFGHDAMSSPPRFIACQRLKRFPPWYLMFVPHVCSLRRPPVASFLSLIPRS